MSIVIPDFDWYSRISKEHGVSPRCPFATAHHCPRYYQSLYFLKNTGATSIDHEVDESLFQRWKKSPLWPLISEQSTSVFGSEKDPSKILSNFCPEVSYDRFSLFASFLARYADEIDLNIAHEGLSKRGVSTNDWRWQWASVRPVHYIECPLYSILQHPGETTTALEKAGELLEIKPGAFGISVNIKNLISKFCVWWLRRQRKDA